MNSFLFAFFKKKHETINIIFHNEDNICFLYKINSNKKKLCIPY